MAVVRSESQGEWVITFVAFNLLNHTVAAFAAHAVSRGVVL